MWKPAVCLCCTSLYRTSEESFLWWSFTGVFTGMSGTSHASDSYRRSRIHCTSGAQPLSTRSLRFCCSMRGMAS